MIRRGALASLLLVCASGCGGETLLLGERFRDDAGEELTTAIDGASSPQLDAMRASSDAPRVEDAGSEMRATDAHSPIPDAGPRDSGQDNAAWHYCSWDNFDTDCPPSQPYCSQYPIFGPGNNVATLWVCLECRVFSNEGCQDSEVCWATWGPKASCIQPLDAGHPPGKDPNP